MCHPERRSLPWVYRREGSQPRYTLYAKRNTQYAIRDNFAFLVFFATWDAESAAILLKLRWNLGIIGLELCRSASKTVSKCAGTPFMKLSGNPEYRKYRLKNLPSPLTKGDVYHVKKDESPQLCEKVHPCFSRYYGRPKFSGASPVSENIWQ